ncbi:MAG: MBOAT family protein [Clostridiales bacterium]|nr:MBOAT family protein [Clostridiales bacterium]
MVFSSLPFLYLFLPATLLLYYLAPGIKLKNGALLLASIAFYALGEPAYVILLVAATFSAYVFAPRIAKNRELAKGKVLLAISVAINVSFLVVFKYVPLLAKTANDIFGAFLPVPKLQLPIGISFYTFQVLTYTIDVYRGKTEPQRSFAKLLLYISMFPQLIAGPIVRYADVEKQIEDRNVSVPQISSGILCFVCGLAKKALIADHAGKISSSLLGTGAMSTIGAWLGILLFAFQIYFDFSGYSDMAIGLGRMFGFEFMQNFNYPYISRSVTEFWRRWHMSLGTFFRDYVYIPLGGNRKRQGLNIAVVWILTGFWHGAEWNFVLWGAYFGAILAVEKFLLPKFLLLKFLLPKIHLKVPSAAKWAVCFFTVNIGWVIFSNTDLLGIWHTLEAMFSYRAASFFEVSTAKQSVLFLAFCMLASTPLAKNLATRALKCPALMSPVGSVASSLAVAVFSFAILGLCTISLAASSYSPFLYFRF